MTTSQRPPDTAGHPQLRVVVADNHPVVCSGIVYQLEQQPDITVLGTAADGDTALKLAQMHQPDVLVLDMRMPGLRAVEVVRELRTHLEAVHVLMLSAYDDIEQVLALLAAGATGYALKDEDPTMIVVAVRAVAQGKRWLSAAIAASVLEYTVSGVADPSQSSLTSREWEILRLLAMAVTNQEIADRLSISVHTVRFHITNICSKLDLTNRSEVIAWAARHNLSDE